MEAQGREEIGKIEKKEDKKMCKHMRGKVDAPMLGSKEVKVAGGHWCNTRSCTVTQSGVFFCFF